MQGQSLIANMIFIGPPPTPSKGGYPVLSNLQFDKFEYQVFNPTFFFRITNANTHYCYITNAAG